MAISEAPLTETALMAIAKRCCEAQIAQINVTG
jgi:hypothetical protein